MATGWQRQFAAAVREANRLRPHEREALKQQQAHDKKFKTRPLSRRFYCPSPYRDVAGNERVCGYWDASDILWRNGFPFCVACGTAMEIHPGMTPNEVEKEQRQLRKARKSAAKTVSSCR
jgi:hypothetical protein